MDNIIIRPFDEKTDVPGAAICFFEGFHHIMWPLLDNSDPGLIHDLIRAVFKVSPHSFVAEDKGEVCAILLGGAPFGFGGFVRGAGYAALCMTPKMLVNAYKLNYPAFRHLMRMGWGYAPFLKHHPLAWPLAEIALFTSCRASRGQGTGRKLMDAFVAKVKDKGLRGAHVCTDTALSYQFYEAYGFGIAGKFPMKAYKYSLPGQTHQGRVYYLGFGQDCG